MATLKEDQDRATELSQKKPQTIFPLFKRLYKECVFGSISGSPWGARGWCSFHVSDTVHEILADTGLWKKQTCSKLIQSPLSLRAKLLVNLQAEARVSPDAGKLQIWELYLAGISGCYHRGVFLHVCERKERANSHGLTFETLRSGVPVMPERSAWSVNTSTIPILLSIFVIS